LADDWDDEDASFEDEKNEIFQLAFIDKDPGYIPRILWPPRREPQTEDLNPSVPEFIRKCHRVALRVRPFSPDLYAVQLRKTLEAICRDLGADEFISGTFDKRAMLWQQIEQLEREGKISHFISLAKKELKDLSNVGAHYSEAGVSGGRHRQTGETP
jgi:Domain of unknown function (DUF4145)